MNTEHPLSAPMAIPVMIIDFSFIWFTPFIYENKKPTTK